MAGCPPFTVTVSGDLGATLDRVKRQIVDAGGTFDGNTEAGSFSGSVALVGSFEGEYTASGSDVTITITKKPWNPLASCDRIESKIRDYFAAG
jgi:hypothetical protein